ncbi:MAG: hypothetical protein D6B25_10675 [Desulfobulbaceae bacterium]|nr:MAG: hypothetical protein D6B25_10675 [Desulfobulbaceae bacterium]
MNLISRFHFTIIALFVGLMLANCSTVEIPENTVINPQQPTGAVVLTFDESTVPDHCKVFSHLIFTVPPDLSKKAVRTKIETFAKSHGSDYLLIGLARESSKSTTSIIFKEYGPSKPYLFSRQWTGWRFGFSDWTGGGPLMDYGYNHIQGEGAVFDRQVDVQAIMLSCQIGPAMQ